MYTTTTGYDPYLHTRTLHGALPILAPLARRRARPEQMMFAILLRRAKQVCAQRNREGGVVDLHGDERSGALAGAVPARTAPASACSVSEEEPTFGVIVIRRRDRKGVVWAKRVCVRVTLGGRR